MTSAAECRAIAALYWPGWLAIGRPDVSARIAERGIDCDQAQGSVVDEWDWQRRVPVTMIGGRVEVFEYAPDGYIRASGTRFDTLAVPDAR